MLRSTKPAKCKHCAHCKREFIPQKTMQQVCGPLCASRMVRAKTAAKKVQDRQQTRTRREAIKTIPDLIREAQTAFNAFVRARDEGKPCICCGGMPKGDPLRGGAWDCGHYRSTGSAPHLRFDERNAHRQLARCNRHGAGRAVDYRIGLIARIGLAEVEALEADNRVHKWERDELREIRDTYRAKLKAIKAEKVVA